VGKDESGRLMKEVLGSLGVLAKAFGVSLVADVAADLPIGFLGSAIICRNDCVEYPLAPWLVGAMVGLLIIMVGTSILRGRWSKCQIGG